jgi:hypothetical protein
VTRLITSSKFKNQHSKIFSPQKKTRRPQDIVVTVNWITDCKGRIFFALPSSGKNFPRAIFSWREPFSPQFSPPV